VIQKGVMSIWAKCGLSTKCPRVFTPLEKNLFTDVSLGFCERAEVNMCFHSVFNRQFPLKKKCSYSFVLLPSHIDVKNYANNFPVTK